MNDVLPVNSGTSIRDREFQNREQNVHEPWGQEGPGKLEDQLEKSLGLENSW